MVHQRHYYCLGPKTRHHKNKQKYVLIRLIIYELLIVLMAYHRVSKGAQYFGFEKQIYLVKLFLAETGSMDSRRICLNGSSSVLLGNAKLVHS